MDKTKGEGWDQLLPPSALLASILFLLAAYQPVLAPLADPHLQFRYGDFTTIFGEDSAGIRAETTFYAYGRGRINSFENRLFTLAMFSAVSEFFPFSDTQLHSALILLSMVLGCLGIYLLVMRFEPRACYRAGLIIFLAVFYFMNFWAVERMSHTWIWFTYAVFPLFLFLGLLSVSGSRGGLVLYSLVIGFFGFLPHSFIYLSMIHAVLALYALLSSRPIREVAVFAIVPMVIYAGINLPAISLFPVMDSAYPISFDSVGPNSLSRNGELLNLLAFSNGWWPQTDIQPLLENPVFRYSGILILISAFLILMRSDGRMGQGMRMLALLCCASILCFMFIAQGTNNQILAHAIDFLEDIKLTVLLGPFREWARISILIPVFASIVFIAGIAAMPGREARFVMAALLLLLAANVAWSPSWTDLQKNFAAKAQHPDNARIAQMIGPDAKVLVLESTRAVQDFFRFPSYPTRSRVGQKALSEELSPRLLDAYGFTHVLKDSRAKGLGPEAYEWLGCTGLETVEVCHDGRDGSPFRSYSRLVASTDPGGYADALLLQSGGRVATASINVTSAYVAGNSPWPGTKMIRIIEGEDMRGQKDHYKKLKNGSLSSGAALSISPGTSATYSLNLSRGGEFTGAYFGSGTLDLTIGGQNISVSGNGTGPAYFGPLALKAGVLPVRATAIEGAVIDSIWLYEGGGTVGQLASAPAPARIISQEMVDPSKWKAILEADSPFVLSLAEPYNRNFEARVVDGQGRLTNVKSIEILGGVNGFVINQSGDLEVEVLFGPQETYSAAFASTWATLLACAACLGYLAYRGTEGKP